MQAPSSTDAAGGAVAVPLQDEREMKTHAADGSLLLPGVDDDAEYLQTHSHPRSHPHEKEPEGPVFQALYALEGGDPDSEVDVVHEETTVRTYV